MAVWVQRSGSGCAKSQAETLACTCLLVHLSPRACLLGVIIIIDVSVTAEGQSQPGSAALAKLGNSDFEL